MTVLLNVAAAACAPAAPGAEGADDEFAVTEADEARVSNDVFVTVRRDTRRCAYPFCGGYWVARVNYATIVCADGRSAASCYVSEVDLAPTALPAAQRDQLRDALTDDASAAATVLRGGFRPGASGAPATFAATDVFRTPAPEDASRATVVHGVAREGCTFQPCAPSRLASANSSRARTPAVLDFARAGGTAEERDLALLGATSERGVLVRGALVSARVASDPRVFNVSQYYLRANPELAPGACGAAFEAPVAYATDRLLYTSESDYPFAFVMHPGLGTAPLTPARFLALTGQPADTAVETRTVERFFAWPATDQPDAPVAERAVAARYRVLRRLLERGLTDLQVFRTGSVEIQVYVVGRDACGNLVGVRTTAIET